MATTSRRSRRTAAQPTSAAAPRTFSNPRWWLVPAGLALLCLAAYANSFTTGFTLDNRQLILRDPRVHAFTATNLRLIVEHSYWWPYGESGLYRPLTTLTYLLNYAVFGNGDRPAGYHWFNLLLHLVNVLLVWRVVWRITSLEWTAVASAALWAVVPLSTEAVTNIVGRADLMAASASLSALLLYLRWRMEPPGSGLARTSYLIPAAIAVLITLGTLAKESAVAVLGVLATVELLWWQGTTSARRLIVLAGACALPLTLWWWQRTAVLGAGGAAEFPFTDNPIVGATFWHARLTAVQVMWRYVALLAWPAHLSIDYSYPQIPLASGSAADWAGVLLLVAAALAGLWQVRTNRSVLFFAAFTFITFLPASNLLFATGTIMGERLVYLPSAGLAALVSLALTKMKDAAPRHLATGVVSCLVLAYGARTVVRNADWKDDLTLWRSAVSSAPASAKAHRALAEALYDSDPSHAKIDDVIASADRAVALLEPVPDEQNTFQAFRQAGAYYLDKANQIATRSGTEANAELKRLYSRALHLLDRAVVIARLGASQLPGGSVEPEADAQRLRAAAMLGLENPSLALNAAKRSRSLSPLHPLGYRLSASALLAMHRDEEAVMTLLAGSIVSGDPALGQEAMRLYAGGVDQEGCAVVGSGSGAALNPQCATVVRHSCIASAAAYQILRNAGQAQRSEATKSTALATFACPAGLMDRSNSLVP